MQQLFGPKLVDIENENTKEEFSGKVFKNNMKLHQGTSVRLRRKSQKSTMSAKVDLIYNEF